MSTGSASSLTPTAPRRTVWALIPILLLVTWLGARQLNATGIWYDEWWSLYVSGSTAFGPPLDLPGVWARVASDDPLHPPGAFMALSVWGRAVGWAEGGARAFSLLIGLLAVACTYQLGRTLSHDTTVGIGAAAVIGSSAWFLNFTHDIRSYALLIFCSALLMVLYARLMERRRPSPLAYLSLTLSGAAACYVHYFGVLALVVVGVWHIARFRRDRRWWVVLVALILAGALFLPWVGNALPAFDQRERANQVDADMLQVAGEIVYVFSSTGIALYALIALWGVFGAGGKVRNKAAIWLLAAFAFALSLATMRALRLNEIRYALGALPLMAVAVGIGFRAVQTAAPRALPILIVVMGAAAISVESTPAVKNLNQRFPSGPIREMVQVIRPHLREGDVVINLLGEGLRSTIQANPLSYYMGDLPGRVEIVERVFLPSVAAFVGRVRQAVGESGHVWALYSPEWPSTEWSLFLHLLEQDGFRVCATLSDTPAMRIMNFADTDGFAPSATFTNGIGIGLLGEPTERGGQLRAIIGFAIDPATPPETYSFSLRVVDSQGAIRAQVDQGLPGVGVGCRFAPLEVSALPPGQYQLQVVVYEWRTLAALPAADGSTAGVEIGRIRR